jgi:hypothetical protein
MPQTFNVGSRSVFVTVTAWIFILLAAGASLSALAQSASFASLFPRVSVVGDAPLPIFSGLIGLVVAYLPWVTGASFVLSAATLASAIGLLLRQNWARRAFIGLMALAIAANLLGLWLQYEVVQAVVNATLAKSQLPTQFLEVFGGFVTAARVMAAIVTLGACLVLAWIIRRLMSSGVRQEFA